MRTSCLKCVLKHLGQAMILVEEAEMGYPFHRYFAMAHMAEASSECLSLYPDLAQMIRDERKKYEEYGEHPELLGLMIKADKLLAEKENRPPTPLEFEPGEEEVGSLPHQVQTLITDSMSLAIDEQLSKQTHPLCGTMGCGHSMFDHIPGQGCKYCNCSSYEVASDSGKD